MEFDPAKRRAPGPQLPEVFLRGNGHDGPAVFRPGPPPRASCQVQVRVRVGRCSEDGHRLHVVQVETPGAKLVRDHEFHALLVRLLVAPLAPPPWLAKAG